LSNYCHTEDYDVEIDVILENPVADKLRDVAVKALGRD
jgi:hypothetical protein